MTPDDIRAYALELLPAGTGAEVDSDDATGSVKISITRPSGHSDGYWRYRVNAAMADMLDAMPLCIDVEWEEQ